MPPAPNKEAVKVLAKAVGVREAARQLGLPEERVKKWSQRDPAGHWGGAVVSVPFNRGGRPCSVPTSPNVPTPSEALANSIESLSKRGRYAYLAAGVTVGEAMASHAARLAECGSPEAILEALLPEGQNAKAWAGTTALAGSWEAKQPVASVMVSVKMLGMRPEELVVEQKVIDVEQA